MITQSYLFDVIYVTCALVILGRGRD